MIKTPDFNLDSLKKQALKLLNDERTPRFCIIIVGALIVYTFFSFLWMFFYTPKVKTQITTLKVEQKKAPEKIANFHIFGEDETGEQITLNLTLHAIFYDKAKSENSSALISQDGQPQKHYREGDAFSGGAKVQSIFPDKIVVKSGRGTQTVKLPTPELKFAPPPKNTLSQ